MENVNPYQSPPTSSPLADETVAREAGPATPSYFCSARPWGVAACFGFWLQVMAAFGVTGLQFALLKLYDVTTVEEIDVTIEQWILYGMNVTFVSMVVVRLLTAVPFLVWTYRAYANLLALGHASVDWKPFMAPVSWLIPLFNFIAPCLVMRELRWRSDPHAEVIGKSNTALQYVNLWWGAWILLILMTMISNGLNTGAATLADHVQAIRFNIATNAVLIACGLLAIWLVVSIDRLQLRRYAALSAKEA